MNKRFNRSVVVDDSKCIGCTDCLKKCPVESIRIKDSKASINERECIDCGSCMRVCKQKAMIAKTTPSKNLLKHKYTVAVPTPSIYAQFNYAVQPELVLTGLKRLGFDYVFEVAEAANLISTAISEYLMEPCVEKPIISTTCPSIIRLIQSRFPSLLSHLLPLKSPREIAVRLFKREVVPKLGISLDDVGVFYISSCPSCITSVLSPWGQRDSEFDGAFSIAEIYHDLIAAMKEGGPDPDIKSADFGGIQWAIVGGEMQSLGLNKGLEVDGLLHVHDVLDMMEKGTLPDIKYVELRACVAGCVGGPLNVVKPHLARAQLLEIIGLPRFYANDNKKAIKYYKEGFLHRMEPIPPKSRKPLDRNPVKAMLKMKERDEIVNRLPGLDCGSCGSPSCICLAEDVVIGNSQATDCIFILREKVQQMAEDLLHWAGKVPVSMYSKRIRRSLKSRFKS